MAKEALVNPYERFYNEVRQAVEELHRRHGPLYLGAVIQFEDRPSDEWTVMVGSRLLASDPGRGMKTVARELAKALSDEHANWVRRLGIIGENDDFLLRITKAVSVAPIKIAYFVNCDLYGIQIRHGAVFAAQRDVKKLHSTARKKKRKGKTR